ncbi:thiol reductant ABC exporter subunit CydD [Paenibacillus nasutitermitis]|uniref:Thiol reductant ABC exporter subunit CydD n=1 Tax=Paenibacillus nasutitermitis TaxID=1652958 RepID=A0A917DZD7_9BACL|nr:thiol reductant ABC exporter subunit CydD [Paenibacillus nasutitermitis]GGD84773.1 hypothetical protein GCM10010911_48940 [Paenibacillus nasutitermitis]
MMKKLLVHVPGTRKLVVLCVGLGLAGGMCIILEAAGLARIVNGAFLGGLGLSSLLPLFGLLLGVIVLRVAVQTVSDYASGKAALRIKSELRLRLLHKLGELGPNYAKSERSGELVGTLYEGVEQLEAYLARYLPQMALSMLIPAAVFCVVMDLDGLSAVILAVTFPLLIIFMILVGMAAKSKAERQFKTLGRLGGHFLDVLRGLSTLKMFNRSRAQIAIIARISEDYRKTTMGTLRLAFLSAFVMELFATLSTAIVAVFLGLRLIEGEIGFQHAFLVLLLTPEFYLPVRALGTQFHASTNGMAAAARIMDILETEPPGWMEREDAVNPPDVSPHGCRIEFQGVSLRYPGHTELALSDINLVLEPGERAALIGPTGAGKSSLLDLLQGFVKPTSGRILLDGVDMADLSMNWWRRQFSAVTQNPRLYHGTLRENVTMGVEAAGEAKLAAALQTAGVDFLDGLPQGVDTPIGESVRLSGGQIQRLAIARSLLKETPLLLLDEPTSGLDLIHEAALMEGLDALLRGRMSITVAHRLETVRHADRIIVIDGGRVIETGSHVELMQADGLYARMTRVNEVAAGEFGGTLSSGAADVDREVGQQQTAVAREQASGMADGRANAVQMGTKWIDESQAVDNLNEAGQAGNNPMDAGQMASGRADATQADGGSRGSIFRRVLEFVRPYKGRAALAVLLGFLTVAANVGLMGTSGYLIARAALRPDTVLLLWIPIVGVRFFGIARGVMRYLERLVAHDVTFRILQRVRVWLYERLERNGTAILESRRSGDVLHAIMNDVEQLQNLYLRVLAPPMVALLTGALGLVLLGVHHAELAVILAVMMAVSGIGLPWLGLYLGRKHGEGIIAARAGIYEETVDLIAGVRELTVFNRLADRLARIQSIQDTSNSFQKRHIRLDAGINGGILASAHLTMWLVLLASVYLAASGRIEAVAIPALAMITLACFEAIMPLPAAFQQMNQTMASAERLFRLADEKPAAEMDGVGPGAVKAEPGTGTTAANRAEPVDDGGCGAVGRPLPETGPWRAEIQDLSFRYGPDEPYAIRDLSITLAPGKRIAIVGESGAGKSSLIQVLLKLRPYTAGSVTIRGRELRQLTDEAARSEFAVVSQTTQLFNASAAANIRLGCPDATDEELRTAARLALIDDTLMNLPEGYNTEVGEWGSKLSGGERQRLALARALLVDAPAILFDEPATGLDPLTEQAFRMSMETQLKDKAVLWITHKLAGLAGMDEIIVMQGGMVRERGTHLELLRRRGYYARLWQLEREQDWREALAHHREGA